MSALGRIDGWLFAPAPAERLGLVRLLTGMYAVGYMIVTFHAMTDFGALRPERFAPEGLAKLLAAPLPTAAVLGLYGATLLSGFAFAIGWRFRVTGPAFALLLLATTSYRHSWGMLFHTDNLLVLHVLVLALAPAAEGLSLDARRRGATPDACGSFGWPLRLIALLTTLTYVLAALAKAKVSGLSWMEGEILRNHLAYDAVRKLLVASTTSPLGGWLVQHEWPFPILGVGTMAIELVGPLTLVRDRWARAWAVAIWGFHLGVLATMAIGFAYPLSGIAYAAFFPCERLLGLPALRRALRPLGGGAPRPTGR